MENMKEIPNHPSLKNTTGDLIEKLAKAYGDEDDCGPQRELRPGEKVNPEHITCPDCRPDGVKLIPTSIYGP